MLSGNVSPTLRFVFSHKDVGYEMPVLLTPQLDSRRTPTTKIPLTRVAAL